MNAWGGSSPHNGDDNNNNNNQKHTKSMLTPRPAPLWNPVTTDLAAVDIKQSAKMLREVPIKGDGKCMFRAIAQGLAASRGMVLSPKKEEDEADELRRLVHRSLCLSRTADEEAAMREKFADAIFSISHGDQINLPKYCSRVASPSHWGGEPEMIVLSTLLRTPIAVWTPPGQKGGQTTSKGLFKSFEPSNNNTGSYTLVSVYGKTFAKDVKNAGLKENQTVKGKSPICLLYNGRDHYSLLL